MEKIILVNTVETSSQPSSSEINIDGNVVKVAITYGQQVLFRQVVLAHKEITAITTNHLESITLITEVGERGRRGLYFPQVKPVRCPRSRASPVEKSKKKLLRFNLYPCPTEVRNFFCKFSIKALERLLADPETVANASVKGRLEGWYKQGAIALYNKSDHYTQSSTNLSPT